MRDCLGRQSHFVHLCARGDVGYSQVRRTLFNGVVICAVLALHGAAAAQNQGVTDIEVPSIVIDNNDAAAPVAPDESIDLANIVRSAAKGITTVQEAPAIVTVIDSDEIRDRQFHDFQQIINTVPGWSRMGYWYSTVESVLVRGQVQAVQFLQDGVALFDPGSHVPALFRTVPLEVIKRVEMITGPGGVLWGSNSLMGIINVITKDAEDVEGIEVGGAIGDGIGDRRAGRAYLLAGVSDIAGTKLKLFAHAGVESYKGAGVTLPLLLYRASIPQPSTPNVYGPLTLSDQKRSLVLNLDGKITYDKLQLRWQFPLGAMYRPAGLAGQPVRDRMDPNDPMGVASHHFDEYDRYGVLEYRTRFAKDKAGIAARAYMIQFVRNFHPLTVLAPSPTLQGGLQLDINFEAFVAGAAVDGDVELVRRLRVLYGAEASREWNAVTNGRTGSAAGTVSDFPGPYNVALLPLPCPREYVNGMLVPVPKCPLTGAFNSNRIVLSAYVNPQYRPSPTLSFDAGARLSVAPASLGTPSYKPNTSVAGAIVWNFAPNWHVKLNYTEGYRPPTFNGISANGEGAQISGNPKLEIERSQAAQAEINARIFKGDRRIRELSFRVDGSYTRLPNLIQIVTGTSTNAGARGIISAEFLGKLYLQGGHRIDLGYTWLRTDSAEVGRLRNTPEHWFNLGTVWSLLPKTLTASTNIRISGAAEDPNRIVEYRGIGYDASGQPMGTTTSIATDLVLDRLPPIAELSAGIQYMPVPKFAISASVFNALYAHAYQPDAYADYEPHLEYLPNPMEGFRAYLTASLQY